MTKKNSGITLVALTVTVIVLLILAGISIAILQGDQGTINNAMKAKQGAEYAQTKEDLMSKWLILENETRKQYNDPDTTAEKFEDKLKEDDEDATASYDPETDTYDVHYNGIDVALTPEGDVISPEEKPTAEDKPSASIAEQPQNKEVFVGSSTSIQTSATVTGTPSYQWYAVATNTTTGGTPIRNATNPELQINNAQKADRKYYYCEVTTRNNGKTEKTKTTPAYIKVIDKITPADITTANTDVTVNAGGTLSLSITTDVEGELAYQWYKSSNPPANEGELPADAQPINGETRSTYTKDNISQQDSTGYYYCKVTQTVAGETAQADSKVITVNSKTALEIITQPEPKEVPVGEEINLTVEAKGSGTITYQWYKIDAGTTQANAITNPTGGTAIEGATKSTYPIASARTSNSGYYYCEVRQVYTIDNTDTTIKSQAVKVTVNKVTPTLELSEAEATLNYGDTVSFTAITSAIPAVNGTLEVTSSNPQAIEITAGNNANVTNNQPTTITYNAKGATAETVTITIKFIPSDLDNYEEVTATYTIAKVNKLKSTLPTQITAYSGEYDGVDHEITVSEDYTGGTLKYSISTDNGANYSEWTTTKPKRKDEGTTFIRIKVEGDANHEDSETVTSTIHISQSSIELTRADYNGEYDTQSHGITLNVTKPIAGYTIYYSTIKALHSGNFTQGSTTAPTRTDVGTTTVYWYIDLNGSSNYANVSGSNSINITPKSIEAEAIQIDSTPASFTYNGQSQKPLIRVTDTQTGQELQNTIDYNLAYPEDTTNAGTKNITITGAGNYDTIATEVVTYQINQKSIEGNDIVVTLSNNNFIYNKQPQKPAIITIQDTTRNVTLTEGTDYTLTYPEDITNVGQKTITINGINNYNSSITVQYAITQKDISDVTIALSPDTFVYDGTAKTPIIEVRDEGTTLTQGTDYTVSITNNVNIGTATVTITGAGNYDSNTSKIANFTITERSAANFTVTVNPNTYTYDGTAKTPTVTVKDGDNTLTENTDYTLTITNNVNAGSALVTIVGKGNYDVNSTKTANFTITKLPITVTAGSSTKTYDGTPLTNNNVTITDGTLAQNQTFTGTASGTITNVGSVENPVSTVVVKDANDEDVTNNYQITKQSGALVITGTATTIEYTAPGPIIKGNETTLELQSDPEVSGTWTMQAGAQIEIVSGNNTAGTTANITYKGLEVGTTDVIITFTPTDPGYSPSTVIFNQTITDANYQVGTTYYTSLAEAVAAVEDNGTITLLKNVEDTENATIDKTITINLDTYTITRSTAEIIVANNGTLTIEGTGTITGSGTSTINANSGTVNINSGNIENTAQNALSTQNNGTINIGRETDPYSEDTPMVTGEVNGILVTQGTWNFYNGGVRGKTNAASQDSDDVRGSYIYDTDNDGTYEIAVFGEPANAPVLTEGMIPIKWNGSNWVICSTSDPEWYSYTAKEKKWANVMLSDGTYNTLSPVGTSVAEADLGSMFVWIPRYAYSIVNGFKTGNTKNAWDPGQNNIRIRYMVGTTNKDIENTEYPTDYNMDDYPAGSVSPMIVHPTFTTQKDQSGNTIQLPGVWIAKFEASNNSGIVASKPNVTSWRNITIGNMQYNSASMSSNIGYGWTANTINTHLIKASELGSVAYLSYSRYGNIPMVNGNNGYITGMGPNSINGSNASESSYANNTTNNATRTYDQDIGQYASTTKNTYGIYDMSGGAWEYTGSFLNNGHVTLKNAGNPSANTSVKYFDDSTSAFNTAYSYLWEPYEMPYEVANDHIAIEDNGTTTYITKAELWAASGNGYKSDAINAKYNTARERIKNAIVGSIKGVGLNETGTTTYKGVNASGSYTDLGSWSNWNQDINIFGGYSTPFVYCGATYNHNKGTGVLSWEGYGGGSFQYAGFRPAINPPSGPITNITVNPTSGTIILGNGNLTAEVTTKEASGTLSVASSNNSVATASITQAVNGVATLTVTPVNAGTAVITITEANGNKTATYTAYIQEANYTVAGRGYQTLESAVSATEQENVNTITVLRSCDDEGTVTINQNLTLELGNNKINRTSGTITVGNNSTLTINAESDGQINSGVPNMLNISDGTLNINGATIQATSGDTINLTNATANINSGKIISNAGNAINLNSGTVNVGTTQGAYDEDAVMIIGEGYGINRTSSGEWNLYNGSIKGKTSASNVQTTNYRNSLLIDGANEDTYDIAFLTMPANAPVLVDGMIPIKWDDASQMWVICSTSDPSWYSYTSKDKKWANIMLSDGTYKANGTGANSATIGQSVAEADLGSMFVWIPRYAYSIQNGFKGKNNDGTDIATNEQVWVTNTKSQNIKTRFLVGKTNADIDGTTYDLDYNLDDYQAGSKTPIIVHPTFTTQKDQSGSTLQLPGVWISKFEASNNGGSVLSKPNVTSWRNITIGTMQYESARMATNTNYGWNPNEVTSHLIKASEWGSVAYLTYSRYGNIPMVNGNNGYITGMGPNTETSEARWTNSTTNNSTRTYDQFLGTLASTTKNTSGIYDMSGGSWEGTGSFLNNGHNNLNYGNTLNVIYFNKISTNPDRYELNPTYAYLWEPYEMPDEVKNDHIEINDNGTITYITKEELWSAYGANYKDAEINIKYNTARERIANDIIRNLHGIGLQELGKNAYWIVNTAGNYYNAGSNIIYCNNDYSLFGGFGDPFVARGGENGGGSNSGVTYWIHLSGTTSSAGGFRVAVIPPEVANTGITVSPTSGTIILGNGNLQATVTTKPESGALSTASSNPGIATATVTQAVDNQAVLTVTPHSAGTATITIKENTGNRIAVYTVNVLEANYQVGSKYYNTLATAVAGAELDNIDTINVLRNCEDAGSITINRNIAINLGNNKITKTSGTITVGNNSTLTINANENGAINAQVANAIDVDTGTVTINGGTIKTISSNAINLTNATANINSGNIISDAGIAVNVNSGTVNVGSLEQKYDDSNVNISAETYGVYSVNGEWNLYNGQVKGKALASNIDTTNHRNNFLIDNTNEDTYDIAFLSEPANAPVLAEGMIPIKWDDASELWVICSTTDPDWYSYTAKDKKWANIMLSDGRYKANGTGANSATIGTSVAEADLGSMFVWVPRYAYSIQNGFKGVSSDGSATIQTEQVWVTNTKSKNIKTRFLVGKTNADTEGTTYKLDYNMDDYPAASKTPMIVHPTFTTQKDQSGSTIQLPGVWISKFEASNNAGNVASKPNVTSWRITIGNMQYNSASMSSNTTYGWTANTVNTHLIKNSEWGATAYLLYSRYGNIPMSNGNSGRITGMGPNSENSESQWTDSTANRATRAYDQDIGQLASTTKNTYGIYDMSGGNAEYVSSFVNNGHNNFANGNTTNVTYFNKISTNPDRYEFNTQYSYLWESYEMPEEVTSNHIAIEDNGETTYITKEELWNAYGANYKSEAVNAKYNEARLRIANAIFGSLRGVGLKETGSSFIYKGVNTAGNYADMGTSSNWNSDSNYTPGYDYPFIVRGGASNGNGTGGVLNSSIYNGSAYNGYAFHVAITPPVTPSTNITVTPTSGTIVLGNGNLQATVTTMPETGTLSVASSDASIATASIGTVSNNQATLTITPQSAGTATITVTENAGNKTATYEIEVQEANYQVGGTNYNTLATAYAGAKQQSASEITVLKDVTDNSALLLDTQDVTLNLSTHTVTRGTGTITVGSGRTLTIAGTGTLVSTGANTITTTNGTITINDAPVISGGNYAINSTSGAINYNGGTIKGTTDPGYSGTITPKSGFRADTQYVNGYYETSLIEQAAVNVKIKRTTLYEPCDEVTFAGEQFYVLKDDADELKLLAKHPLNLAGTAQINLPIIGNEETASEEILRPFSKTNYWSSVDSSDYSISSVDGGQYLDLQSEEMITAAEADGDVAEGVPNAVIAARNYGLAKGVTGRLPSMEDYEEFYATISSLQQSNNELPNKVYSFIMNQYMETISGMGCATDAEYIKVFLGQHDDVHYADGITVNPVLVFNKNQGVDLKPEWGKTLTANVTTEINGNTSYQWWYADSDTATSGTNIPGATSNTYTIDSAYIGKYIGVTVTVTDSNTNITSSGNAITLTTVDKKSQEWEIPIYQDLLSLQIVEGNTVTIPIIGTTYGTLTTTTLNENRVTTNGLNLTAALTETKETDNSAFFEVTYSGNNLYKEKSQMFIVAIKEAYYQAGGINYLKLAEAYAGAKQNNVSEIILLQNAEDTSSLAIDTQDVILNLQSYTITRNRLSTSGVITVNSGRTLTITGSGTITGTSSGVITVNNGGTLIMNDSPTISGGSYGISNSGTVYFNGGRIRGTTNPGYSGTITPQAGYTLNTVSTGGYYLTTLVAPDKQNQSWTIPSSVTVMEGSVVSIPVTGLTYGTLTSTSSDTSKATVSALNVTGVSNGSVVVTLTYSGDSTYNARTQSCSVTILNGIYQVDGTKYSTIGMAYAAAKLADANEITLVKDATDSTALLLDTKDIILNLQSYTLTRDNGTITVDNGRTLTIEGANAGTIAGSNGQTGIITVTDGTLNVYSGNVKLTGESGVAIYNNGEYAVTNIGDPLQPVSTTTPVILGVGGVSNEDGDINFNSGTVKGSALPISDVDGTDQNTSNGLLNGVRTDYIITYGSEEIDNVTYKTAYLERLSDVTTPWKSSTATYINQDLNTGVTMVDANNNEWTWVVIPKPVTANVSAVGINENPTGSDLENVLFEYSLINNSLLSQKTGIDKWFAIDGNNIITEDIPNLTSAQKALTNGCGLNYDDYHAQKRAMLNGIKEYGGFWIGKYEVGYTETPSSSNYNSISRTTVIRKDAYPYNFIACSDAENKANSIATSAGGIGGLNFGVQWDLTTAYLISMGKLTPMLVSFGNNWGNYEDNTFEVIASSNSGWPKGRNSDTSWSTYIGTKPYASQSNDNGTILLSTGAIENVSNKLNIVDLAGNVQEHTLEYSTDTQKPNIARGGSYNVFGILNSVSKRKTISGSEMSTSTGFRACMYAPNQ